jgi:hypothetical protein
MDPWNNRSMVEGKNRRDAFDLIINVLKEHEENPDNLFGRLDSL